jgi:hypothetical protein
LDQEDENLMLGEGGGQRATVVDGQWSHRRELSAGPAPVTR